MKNMLSNILAIVLVITGAIQTYMQSVGDGPIDWVQLVLIVVGALIAYFTGKSQDLKGVV